MTKYVINGGKTLNGEVTISGAKNAAVAIVPAALLADGPVRIENVPKIIDVTLQMEIMRELGAQIRLINSTTVEIQNTQNPSLKPHELERKLRASYYLLGVLLGKYGFAEVAMPAAATSAAFVRSTSTSRASRRSAPRSLCPRAVTSGSRRPRTACTAHIFISTLSPSARP